jgi:hypothetical protein
MLIDGEILLKIHPAAGLPIQLIQDLEILDACQ